DSAKGISYLERAVALDESAIGKRLELSEAYHLVGRDDDARRVAAQALAMAEQHQDERKIKVCRKFITELEESCRGGALAAAGRERTARSLPRTAPGRSHGREDRRSDRHLRQLDRGRGHARDLARCRDHLRHPSSTNHRDRRADRGRSRRRVESRAARYLRD